MPLKNQHLFTGTLAASPFRSPGTVCTIVDHGVNAFDQSEASSTIILRAILGKPVHELRKGQTWHIGNIHQLSETEVFFAFGRITKSIVERYDEEHGESRSPHPQAVVR